MSDRLCIHCVVSGKVQGVWFRASTRDEARKLGLSGWVKNLPDGRVEVFACGEKDKLEKLHTWLKRGPLLAKVTNLTYEELPWQAHQGFETVD